MGHGEDPKTVEIQKMNLASFNKWVGSTGKRMIVPIPNKAVVYAGFPNTETSKYRALARKNNDLTPMWKAIDQVNKLSTDLEGIVTYDTITDALKRIKSPLPEIRETWGPYIGIKQGYANMLDIANYLCMKKWKLLPKGDTKKIVWGQLSEVYVSNAKGYLAICEGNQKKLKQLDRNFTLINNELKAILKNKNLSKETIETAKYMANRYANHHSKSYDEFRNYIKNEKSSLEKAVKVK